MTTRLVLALDSLLDDDLTVETATAEELGWQLRRWSGSVDELSSADAVVHVRTQVDQDLLSHLVACRVVGRFGTGVDSVDLSAAESANVSVVNVKDYCVDELSNHTLGLGLALTHGLGPRHDNVEGQRHSWQEHIETNPMTGDTTALVVGLGAVGQHLAGSLVALGWRTLIASRRPDAALGPGTSAVSLSNGVGRANIIFLLRELGPETRGFFNEDLIRCLRPGAIVVNTARVGLLDEAAVAEAIRNHTIGGLGLDARLSSSSPLASILDHPRVLVTPHIGWYSERSLHELRRRTVTNTISAYEQIPHHDSGQDPHHAFN